MLQITPTGAWGRDRHPALPLTTTDLLADLRGCLLAGAEGVHLHVRDEDGAETLDPARVAEVCARVHGLAAELGREVEIGLTTGAWIVPDVRDRVAMIREWEGVDCATVNLCEPGFERVMEAMHEVGIGIDVGLRAPAELPLLEASGVGAIAQRVSIELDEDAPPHLLQGDPLAHLDRAEQGLDEIGVTCPRLVHGTEGWTWPLVRAALARGHETRVGFEDGVLLPSGRRAASNAELVAAAVELRDAVP